MPLHHRHQSLTLRPCNPVKSLSHPFPFEQIDAPAHRSSGYDHGRRTAAAGRHGIERVSRHGTRLDERHLVAAVAARQRERDRRAALRDHDLRVGHTDRATGLVEARHEPGHGAGDVLDVHVDRNGGIGGRHDGRRAAGKAVGPHRHDDDRPFIERIGAGEGDGAVDRQALTHEVGPRERSHFDRGASDGRGADRGHHAHGHRAAAEQADAEVGSLAWAHVATQRRGAPERRVSGRDRERPGVDDRERELAVRVGAREGLLDALREGLAVAATGPIVGAHHDDGIGLEAQRDLARPHGLDAIRLEHHARDSARGLQAQVERHGRIGAWNDALARHGLGTEESGGAHGERPHVDAVEGECPGTGVVVAHGEVLHVLELHGDLPAGHHDAIAGDAHAGRQRRVGTWRVLARGLGTQHTTGHRPRAATIGHVRDHRLPIEPHGEGDDVAVAQVGTERREPIRTDAEPVDAIPAHGIGPRLTLHADARLLLFVVAVLEDPDLGVGLRHAVAVAHHAGYGARGREHDTREDLVAGQRQIDGHSSLAADGLADRHDLAAAHGHVGQGEGTIGRVDVDQRQPPTDDRIGHWRAGGVHDHTAHGAEAATEQHGHEGLAIQLQRHANFALLEAAVVEGLDADGARGKCGQQERAITARRGGRDRALGRHRRGPGRIRAQHASLRVVLVVRHDRQVRRGRDTVGAHHSSPQRGQSHWRRRPDVEQHQIARGGAPRERDADGHEDLRAAVGIDGLDQQVADGQARQRERARRIRLPPVLRLIGQAGDAQQRARQGCDAILGQRAAGDRPAPDEHQVGLEPLARTADREREPLGVSGFGIHHHEAQRVRRGEHIVQLVSAGRVGDVLGHADHRAAFAAALELVEQPHARKRHDAAICGTDLTRHHRGGVADGDDNRHRHRPRGLPRGVLHVGHHERTGLERPDALAQGDVGESSAWLQRDAADARAGDGKRRDQLRRQAVLHALRRHLLAEQHRDHAARRVLPVRQLGLRAADDVGR